MSFFLGSVVWSFRIMLLWFLCRLLVLLLFVFLMLLVGVFFLMMLILFGGLECFLWF